MADEVTLDKKLWRFGEEKPLKLLITRDDLGSFTGAAAVLDVYNAAGTQVVTGQAMTVTPQSTYCEASYVLTAKAGGHLVQAGNYDAFVRFTLGGTVRRWRIPIEVLAVP